ncbi:MAG: D-aminoacyl-tRNA deacylase [Saezia sp.]
MMSVIQRVRQAHVDIAGVTVGSIGQGLLVLLCAQPHDTEREAVKMLDKILKLRIFPDEEGKMNRSIMDLDGRGLAGEMLVVSQFTLAADVWSGNRPGFSGAAKPELGEMLYELFVEKAKASLRVATGEFGADMQVSLINDGPVTIPIKV